MPWPLQFLCDTFTTAFAAAMAAVGGDSEVPSDIDDLSVTTQLMMTALTSKACEVRDATVASFDCLRSGGIGGSAPASRVLVVN